MAGRSGIRSACLACHSVDRAGAGPAFAAVAQRYAGEPQAPQRLAAKIRAGGSGSWGTLPMPAQPQLAARDAERLARWVLDQAR